MPEDLVIATNRSPEALNSTVRWKALGLSGLSVSSVGLGCMGMSEFYRVADPASCQLTLEHALETGVRFWDTADIYGKGRNEELLAPFLARARGDIAVATKFGIVRDARGAFVDVNGRPEYAVASCDMSLRRLGVETIDLFYLHKPDPKIAIEETVGAMARLQEAGKIRHLGLSQASFEDIAKAHKEHPIAAVQGELSLWSATYDSPTLRAIQDLGIGFVAHSPLGRGFLTGAFERPSDIQTGDRRHLNPRFRGDLFARNRELVRCVESLARHKSSSLAQIALAWLRDHDARVVPIFGTTSKKHLQENLVASSIALTAHELAELNLLHEQFLLINGPKPTTQPGCQS